MSANQVAETIQTASKVVGAVSMGSAVSAPWWMSLPWADMAIIMSAIGGLFFMLERGFSLAIRILEYNKVKK
jgi:hypothetical protein